MTIPQQEHPNGPSRILAFSQRNLYRPEVWRSSFEEFERIIQEIDSVDILAPKPGRSFLSRRTRAQRIGKYFPIALNPGIPTIRLDRNYDLFLAVCEKPSELLYINALQGWKEKCQTSICWLPELWIRDIPECRASLKVLKRFDHILLNVAGTIEPLGKVIGKECMFLPAGIDALLFSPYPNPPARLIDVLSIGRRSERTHQALMAMAKQDKIFYFYDTLKDLHTYSIEQHRFLMANLSKRSRYFIVNPSKIDAPEERSEQIEFGYRYFEGAASGAIMVGDHPDSREFKEYFPWPDAVIHLPFGSEEIEPIIKELDSQPSRQEDMRRNNIVQSLLCHDWAYRWDTILNLARLDPKQGLVQRKRRLRKLAEIVGQASAAML